MITSKEYIELKYKIEVHQKEIICIFGNNKRSFSREDLDILKNPRPTNEERSMVEVYYFYHNRPEHYFLYINVKNNIATTWMGDKLGDVCFSKEYKCPAFGSFPSTRVPIRMKAINGFNYYGTYYRSSGSYARIKLCKS